MAHAAVVLPELHVQLCVYAAWAVLDKYEVCSVAGGPWHMMLALLAVVQATTPTARTPKRVRT